MSSLVITYDNDGNLGTVTIGSDVNDLTWDYEDRLTRITVGENVYEYKYDGLGNRISRKVNGVETRYVVDPRGLSKVLAETDANGNITAYYVYGLGLISKITPSDQVYYYHSDGIGSTVALSDSSGSIINKYAYDEFGKVLDQQEAIPNPFKFVGQFGVMDEGNGLLYMRARHYDPDGGRFISKDPIGFAGGINMYSYVGNDPVNYIDPSGLDRFEWCGGEDKFFCKGLTNWACGFAPGYCCNVDLTDCMSKIDPCKPGSEKQMGECYKKYLTCLAKAGVR